MSKTRLAIIGALVLAVVGFFLMRAPAPVIAIAAEPVVDIGFMEITNTMVSAWAVIILLLVGAFIIRRRARNVEDALVPSGLQNVVEAIYDAFFNVAQQVAGERNARAFFPFVFTIFIFLLAGNWFGLFPWNNVIGRVENYRYHYHSEMRYSVDDVVKQLDDGEREISAAQIDAINQAFAENFFEPIPYYVDEQDEGDEHIARVRAQQLTELEQSVRGEFAANPIPTDTAASSLSKAIKSRLEAAGVEDHGHDEVKYAMLYNLPLSAADAELVRAVGPILSGGGFKVIPPRTLFDEPRDYSYDAFAEPVYIDAAGAVCLPQEDAACDGAVAATTVNTSQLGFILRLEEKGFAGATVGHIFPFFRPLATDLNLPLAIALWSFIMVQYFGVRGIGWGNNFGKYIGVGSHAVVRGPMGLFVGILEIISEIGRIVSFTFRLFGNMFAGEVVLFVSMFLVAFVIPSVFFGLEVFIGFIQAFVFAMLTLVFAASAVGDHDEHHEAAEGH